MTVPLTVLTGRTPQADELATPIRIALDGLQQSVEPVQFDASKATASFRIAVDNYAAIVLVAPIAAHVARIAPGVKLDFRPSGTLDVLDQLDRSELHMVIGPSTATGERFSRRRLLQDRFVVYIARVIRAQGRRNYRPRSWPRSPSSKSRRLNSAPILSRTDPDDQSLALDLRCVLHFCLQRSFWRRRIWCLSFRSTSPRT
jgi:DNA-binding transcriptional LysR family regulator